MKKTQRRILGAMLQLSDNSMEVDEKISTLSERAGYSASGGMITSALEMLEYHNKIAKLGGEHKWRITI